MEAIGWSTIESWRHVEELGALGVADVEPQHRVSDAAGWYRGNTYGRAWWDTSRDTNDLSEELKKVIDGAILANPNLTGDLPDRLTEELLRLSEQD